MSEIVKIVHFKLETPIKITDEKPAVLVIENATEFYNLVNELKTQIDGEEGNFVFLNNDSRFDPSKIGEMVTDIFNLDFTDKRMSTVLYKKLEASSKDGESYLLLNKLNTAIAEYYASIFDGFSLSFTYDDIAVSDILKIGKVRINETYEGFLEKLVCYVNALVQLKGIKFFVFLHLKSVLSNSDLSAFYKHCQLEKIGLLLIESNGEKEFSPDENTVIITDDLCEISNDNPTQ